MTLPAFQHERKTMQVGYNVNMFTYWTPVPIYADRFKEAMNWRVWNSNPTYTLDDKGNVLTLKNGELSCIVTDCSIDNGVDKRGYPAAAFGEWTLRWKGAGNIVMHANGGQSVCKLVSEDLTGEVKTRVYSSRPSSDDPTVAVYQARMRLIVQSAPVADVQVIQPGCTEADLFHPNTVKRLQSASVIRFMDAQQTNNSNITTWEEYLQPNRAKVNRLVNVVSIGNYENADAYYHTNGRIYLTCTTDKPHGLVTGQAVKFGNHTPLIRLTDGREYTMANWPCVIRVLNATQFAVDRWTIPVEPAKIDGVQQIAVTVSLENPAVIMPEDILALCDQTSSDPWICVPHVMSNDGVRKMAAWFAQRLPKGKKLRVEYSNECWNTIFNQTNYIIGQCAIHVPKLERGGFYAKRSGEVHRIFTEEMTKAGNASSLVRVFNAQSAWPGGPTKQIVDYAAANGIQIDELALAPYFGNGPSTTPEDWNGLTIDQVMDRSEAFIRDAKYSKVISSHAVILKAKFPNANVTCYEGGPDYGAGSMTVGHGAMSRAWARHPRMRGIMLQYLQQLQDDGCTLYVHFTYSQAMGAKNGQVCVMWPAYIGIDQEPGLGDGSDGKFDNRTDFEALDKIVSPVGSAMDYWSSLAVPPAESETRRLLREARERIEQAELLLEGGN